MFAPNTHKVQWPILNVEGLRSVDTVVNLPERCRDSQILCDPYLLRKYGLINKKVELSRVRHVARLVESHPQMLIWVRARRGLDRIGRKPRIGPLLLMRMSLWLVVSSLGKQQPRGVQ